MINKTFKCNKLDANLILLEQLLENYNKMLQRIIIFLIIH
jgi:hypothetical protein